MSSRSLLRVVPHSQSSTVVRYHRLWRVTPILCKPATEVASSMRNGDHRAFSASSLRSSGAHQEETFEEFTARYEKEFDAVCDNFELQRNLNNAFAYDLVPSPSVVVAALKAARRVNDFPTAVRIFEGIKAKVENPGQYKQYLEELKPLREELGVPLAEELYPERHK